MVAKIFCTLQWGPRPPALPPVAMPVTPVQMFIVDVSDEDGKAMSTESADEGDVSSRTLGRPYSNPPTSIGPEEFLELYRTRTVSDPRSDQRLDALSRVRMRKVCMPMHGLHHSIAILALLFPLRKFRKNYLSAVRVTLLT